MNKTCVIGIGRSGKILMEYFQKLYDDKFDIFSFEEDKERSLITFKEWEKNPPKFPVIKNREIIYIVSGADNFSGISLRFLQHLFENKNNVKIIYYLPEDLGFLSKEKKEQEKSVRTILQEYSLLGYFDEMCLVSLLKMGNYFHQTSTYDFYDKLYGSVVTAFVSVHDLQNRECVFGNLMPWERYAKVTTLGILDIESEEEVLFYDLKFAKEKYYYFNVSEKELKSENNFRVKVFDLISNRRDDDRQEILYGVFLGNFEVPFCYSYHRSSLNQSFIV